jgi:hypothetical protein
MYNINKACQPDFDSGSLPAEETQRRSALKELIRLSGKLAVSAIPAGISGLFNKTYSQTEPPETTGIRINHILLIEYLQAEFFATAVAAGLPLLMTSGHVLAFKTIAKHDKQHIDILKGRLIPLKVAAIPKPDFDFTGGSGSGNGPYKDVFTNHSVLGAVARSIKDMAVRAYIAQYKYLVPGDRFYIGPINIHPVESRHAAQLRSLPFFDGLGTELPWITRNHTTVPFDGLRPVYSGEENTVQDGIQIVGINGKGITVDQATEAFDEPLSMEAVNVILNQFIVK